MIGVNCATAEGGGLSISRTETGLDGREAGAYLSSCFFGHWCFGGGVKLVRVFQRLYPAHSKERE